MSKILVVDDNRQNLYLARYLLEMVGHIVDEARNGKEAIDVSNAGVYDLILMDVQMPVMDGLEATRILKQQKPDQVIIALTAKVLASDKRAIEEAGCDAMIEKPFDHDIFLKTIGSYIDRASVR